MTAYPTPAGYDLATTGRQYHLFPAGTTKPLCISVAPDSREDMQVVASVDVGRVCGWCRRALKTHKPA